MNLSLLYRSFEKFYDTSINDNVIEKLVDEREEKVLNMDLVKQKAKLKLQKYKEKGLQQEMQKKIEEEKSEDRARRQKGQKVDVDIHGAVTLRQKSRNKARAHVHDVVRGQHRHHRHSAHHGAFKRHTALYKPRAGGHALDVSDNDPKRDDRPLERHIDALAKPRKQRDNARA